MNSKAYNTDIWYKIERYLPFISIVLIAVGLLAFNHVLEIRAAEGRRALVTYEMMQNNDLLTPYLHGHPYYNKPPFYNWVLAAFFALFGSISEWVLRLPGVLSLLGTAAIMYVVGKRYIPTKVALMGAVGYLTITDMIFFGAVNAGEIDLFYTLIIILQVLAIFWYQQKQKWLLLFLVSYFFTAVGVLTKGLPSLAFQALTLLAYLFWTKDFKRLFGWQHFAGIGLLIGLVGVYFWSYAENGEVAAYLVNTFKQASQRSANEYGIWDVLLNLLVFPAEFLRRLLPWSLGIVFIFHKGIRQRIRSNPFIAFSAIFILVNIPIYWTAPELRIRYTYMFFPFLAMLFVWCIHQSFELARKSQEYLRWIIVGATFITGLALTIGSWFLPLTAVEIGLLIATGIIILLMGYMQLQTLWSMASYWYMIAVIAVLRLTYNAVGMPYTARTIADFSQMTTEMIAKTEGKPLHYYGKLTSLDPSVSLFGNEVYKQKLKIPKDFTVGFGYYDALLRNEVMDNASTIVSGDFYVLYESDYCENLIPLDTMPKMMGGQTMLFCKGK